MNPKELRIGNLVLLDNYKIVKIIWVKYNSACIVEVGKDYPNSIVNISRLSGIELTEEILLKFGFEKYDWFDGCFIKCNNKHLMVQFYEPKQEILIYFTKISKDKDGYKMNGRDYLFKLKKYYVHKLQNLYFTLIDEELEYNKNKPQKNLGLVTKKINTL